MVYYTIIVFVLQSMEKPAYGEADLNKIARDKNPLTQVRRSDMATFEALEEFCNRVEIIAHTVNDNEKWAVLDLFQAPELNPNERITERPVDLYEPNYIVLGMFGGYRSALIQTEQGVECRYEIEDALDIFPNAKFILAVGVAYGTNPEKAKYGDVLVSKFIDGVGNIKYTQEGLIIVRASSSRFTPVSQILTNVFARGAATWYGQGGFECTKKDSDTDEGRKSRVYPGVIISDKALVDNRDVRDNMKKMAPEAIGGEMEGVILVEIKQRLVRGKKAPPRELGVIVMKGVADYGDGSKGKEWQLTAAMAAASYAEHKLEFTEGKLFIEEGK